MPFARSRVLVAETAGGSSTWRAIALPDQLGPVLRRFAPALAIGAVAVVVVPVPVGVAVEGLLLGLLDALVAVGMALLYRSNRILSFAQAELGAAPTVLAVSLVAYGGWSWFLGAGAGLVAAVALGALVELAVIRRFLDAPRLVLTVATIGLAQLLAVGSVALPSLWGERPTTTQIDLPVAWSFTIDPVVLSADHLLALAVAPLALAGVAFLLRSTDLGIALRASAERSGLAALLGVRVKRLQTVVWALAGLLSFLGVFLRAGMLGLPVGETLDLGLLLVALAALLLGRLIDLPVITASALALGLLEQGVAWHSPRHPELVEPVLAAVVVVALLIRRRGSAQGSTGAEADAGAGAASSWRVADDVRPMPAAVRRLAEVRAVRWGGGLLLGALLVALPAFLGPGDEEKAAALAVFCLVGISLVVLVGWAGQVSLGQMSLVGFGAAAGAHATQAWHLDLVGAVLFAGAVGAAVALVVGLPALRLQGLFLAVTTLAFALASTAFLLDSGRFSWVPPPDRTIARPDLLGVVDMGSQGAYYHFCLAVLGLTVLGVRGIRHSRVGRMLLALRENGAAAESFGVNPTRARLTGFALSGFVAAVAGCLLVHLLTGFSPRTYAPTESLVVFMSVVVGGVGSLLGACLGALFLQGGQWFLPGPRWQALASGLGVLLVLWIAPGGLADLAYRLRDAALRHLAARRGRTERTPTPVAVPAPASPDPADPPAPRAGVAGKGAVYGLAVLFGLNLVEEMDRDGFALLIPEIRDAFGMSDAGILSLVAVAALVGLALQVPIAQLADRTHRVRLLLAGAAVFALFSAGTGLVATAWMLCVARSAGGVGMATAGPTHNSLLSDWFPVADRPRVFSIYRVANALGAMAGPIMAGALAAWLGWRAPFLVLAVPTVILIVLAVRLVEPVRGLQERAAMGAEGDLLLTEEPPPSFAESWRMVHKIGSLRRIFHAMPFLAASLVGFASLGALLYERRFGLDELQRSWIAAGAEPAQLVGLFVGARLASRLVVEDPGRVLRLVAGAAFACAGFAAVFALAPWLWLSVAANMAIGTTLAVIGPGIFAGLSLAIPPRARALGFSVGALWVIPGLVVLPVIGLLSDAVGIRAGMLVLLPVFVAGGLVVASAAGRLPADIRQVWTQATARSEYLHERRQGRSKLLLCRDLDVAYGHVQVLFGVDLEVGEGEIVALLGTNGAGKSTLLKAICGVVEADEGAVVLDGRDITHTPPEEIALLGVTQMPGGQGVFPSLTVRENLRMASRRHGHGHGAAVDAVDEVLAQFPVLRARLGEPAVHLSGGQQQMLALGMAFLARPRLLLIDELSLGLAPAVVEQLLPMLRALRDRGTTVVLVEQSVHLALRVAETAYVMEKGEIRFHGPTAELADRPDLLHAVFLPGAAGPSPARRPRPDADAVAGAVAGAVADGVPALEVRDLRVRFGGIPAVAGVSLAVAPGEIVGVVGPNGAGKTTLFDLVSGFVAADGGQVLLDGRDLGRSAADVRARAGLGRSFQDARLFPALTVEETLAVALHRWIPVRDPFNPALHLPVAYDAELDVARRIDELVDLLHLAPLRTKLVRELSTGSRRVVDLACVVAHRPRVVLLDEPSSGIAQRESEALAPLLRRLRDELGCSLVVVEHDLPLVTAVADRLVALDQGRVVAEGPPADVLGDPAVVAAYLGATAPPVAHEGALA